MLGAVGLVATPRWRVMVGAAVSRLAGPGRVPGGLVRGYKGTSGWGASRRERGGEGGGGAGAPRPRGRPFLQAGSAPGPMAQRDPELAMVSGGDPGLAGVAMPAGVVKRVDSAEYLQSCVDVRDCPPPAMPEFALIGRSNVGKSSLINLLTGRKSLALVSKQPGKTRTINHFWVNREGGGRLAQWYLVDLPGYGYAKVGREQRDAWAGFIRDYFLERESLVCVCLLVDASIEPQQVDLECLEFLGEARVPVTLVFTKCDKARSAAQLKRNLQAFRAAVATTWDVPPSQVLTSSAPKPPAFLPSNGRTELLNHLAKLRAIWLAAEDAGVEGDISPADLASRGSADAREDAAADTRRLDDERDPEEEAKLLAQATEVRSKRGVKKLTKPPPLEDPTRRAAKPKRNKVGRKKSAPQPKQRHADDITRMR